jgi:hypothetical protein
MMKKMNNDIMQHPLTTTAGRVSALVQLAEFLSDSMQQKFTGEAFTKYRQCLDDIAKETGGRKHEGETVNDGPVEYVVKLPETGSWRDKLVTALKDGKIEPKAISERLGDDIAAELFKAAGVWPN